MSESKPVDLLLFCPRCHRQHIDSARPEICEACGFSEAVCGCAAFTAWLNPPHKSHRCGACNYIWRPADVPTNGVAAIQTKGQHDNDPRPQYFDEDDVRPIASPPDSVAACESALIHIRRLDPQMKRDTATLVEELLEAIIKARSE